MKLGNLVKFAKRELKSMIESKDKIDREMAKGVIKLVDVFSKQGHSGFSAPYALSLFKSLASFTPLSPLTGEDDEWNDVSEMSGSPMWQNKRYSAVFKEENGLVYNVDGKVFESPDGSRYTNRDSRVEVTFPYKIPERIVVKVDERGIEIA
jgi:hypothetical protein